jgi:hypothetical protein
MRLRYFVHGPTYIDERVILHDDATNKDYVYLLKDLYTVAGLADERGWPVEHYHYDAYGTVHMYRCAMLPYAANLAGDGDVDGSDYVLLANIYNGSGNSPRNPDPGTPNPVLMTGAMVMSRVGNPYLFTARRLDIFDIHNAGTPQHFTDDYAGLTFYDFRARFQLPDLGCFGQRDPLGTAPFIEWSPTEGDPRWSAGEVPDQYADGPNPHLYLRGAPTAGVDPLGLEGTIPPGSQIEIPIGQNLLGQRCGWVTLSGVSSCSANLKYTGICLFPKPDVCKELRKRIGETRSRGCPAPTTCCGMKDLDGTYPITVTINYQFTLPPIAFNCRITGSVTATVTIRGSLGNCK